MSGMFFRVISPRRLPGAALLVLMILASARVAACGGGAAGTTGDASSAGHGGAAPASGGANGAGGAPATDPTTGPPARNPSGQCAVPPDAQLEDVSSPRTVVGIGSAASCTGAAFVSAVAKGGVITFSCGADPVTITLDQTAKIFNDTGPKIVIDGGGKVTLSGGGRVRIL